MTLRKTETYIVQTARRGQVRILARHKCHHPKGKTVSLAVFRNLNMLPDSLFDEACVLDLGIGVWSKRTS